RLPSLIFLCHDTATLAIYPLSLHDALPISLRTRIFFSMIALVVGASILIAIVTVLQYQKDAKRFHRDRLLRKETAIRENINYVLRTTTYPVETNQIPWIFIDKIYEIKDIHGLEIFLYDLQGNLLKSSCLSFF